MNARLITRAGVIGICASSGSVGGNINEVEHCYYNIIFYVTKKCSKERETEREKTENFGSSSGSEFSKRLYT
ncbi:hypothetical protein Y1Q_0017464 [Alligator mississippiensis]|uniref:Uncharacterized protein n=1 Tax=Alligator mississippiensis TaxID=8496 RepID=A0A151P220_ALLMI|nr:hypothetical protein Y1Q_0017464 [Alligator mississippiensis]